MLKRIIPLCVYFLTTLCAYTLSAGEQVQLPLDTPGAVYFTPPENWRMAEASQLPANVLVMVVGKGNHAFAPSINLTAEPFKGTAKQYLKIVKAINDARGASWQDLGTIKTQAGNANLSQVDTKTEWGETRMMHVILLKNNNVYILTAAALKEEFPRFYKEFFSALRSLHINKNVYEMVSSPKKRSELEKAVADLKTNWLKYASQNENTQKSKVEIFNDPQFITVFWIPFKEKLSTEYKDMSPVWRDQLLTQTQNELISLN